VSSPAAMWTVDRVRKWVSAATRRLAAGEDTRAPSLVAALPRCGFPPFALCVYFGFAAENELAGAAQEEFRRGLLAPKTNDDRIAADRQALHHHIAAPHAHASGFILLQSAIVDQREAPTCIAGDASKHQSGRDR